MAAVAGRPLTRAERATAMIDAAARTVANGARPQAPTAKPRRSTAADLKRDAVELARRFGWRGQSYGKAVRFLRQLERRLRSDRAPDPAHTPPSSGVPI